MGWETSAAVPAAAIVPVLFFLLFHMGLEFLFRDCLGSGMIVPGGRCGRHFPVNIHEFVFALHQDGGLRSALSGNILYEVGIGILSAIDGNQDIACSQTCVPGRGPLGHKGLHGAVPVPVLNEGSPHQVEGGRPGHRVAGGAEIKGASRSVQPELAGNQRPVAQDDVNVIRDAHHLRIGETLTKKNILQLKLAKLEGAHMHALVGVKSARRRTVAGINTHKGIRIGLLDGVPAFLGNINGVGCSRVQNDAASVFVCNLRIIGPRNQGQLVPGPYSGRQFIEKRWERLG